MAIPVKLNESQLDELIERLDRIILLLEPRVSLSANFSKGVLKVPNLAEVVGVPDVATVVATSTDKGVVTTVDVSAVSDNTAVLTVSKNADGTFAIDPVAAGACNLTFSGVDSGGETVNPVTFAVTVAAAAGTVNLAVPFSKGVVS